MCGALASTLFDRIASSILTKSPAELVTTADRIAFAPLGTLTKDGVLLNSDEILQSVVVQPSPTLAFREIGLPAMDVGTNALAVRGYPATTSDATDANTFIITSVGKVEAPRASVQ